MCVLSAFLQFLGCLGRNFVAYGSFIALIMQLMTDIDPVSDRILQALSRDGRISNLDLAQRVGLSPSACLRRVQDLERRGIIRGYRAVTDRAALGVGFVAYVTVGLSRHTKQTQADFERLMATAPQVVECHNITGTVEYLLRVEVADLTAYKHFHTEVMGAFPHLNTITTMVVMGSPKDLRA
jgi:Lrp/AsnC family leucine-responsive transcriptional regulator